MKKVQSITTDNGADIIKGVEKLEAKVSTLFPAIEIIENSFHIRCVAHVINLGVKDSMKLIRKEISSIRTVINSITSSTKRRDTFIALCKELNQSVEIPSLDVETRWSSTFHMIRKAYKAKIVITVSSDCYTLHGKFFPVGTY